MPPGEFILARVAYQAASGRQMEAICWYVSEDPLEPSADTANSFAGSISSNVSGFFLDVLVTQAQFLGVAVTMHAAGQIYAGSNIEDSGPGTVDGDESPDFVSVCLRKQGTQAGRSGLGRWFIGAVPESYTNLNSVDRVTAHAKYVNLADGFNTDIAGGANTAKAQHYSRLLNTFGRIGHTSADVVLARQTRRRYNPLFAG